MSQPDAVRRIAAELARPQAASWFRAPGRVNLIGDHTDYNEGYVLPMAIDRECVIATQPCDTVRVRSLDARDAVDVPADGSVDPARVEPLWGRFVAAVIRELAALGRPPVGMDAVLASDVPVGSGLSSSAALEVVLAIALAGSAEWEVDSLALARACRAAEELASGVPCGIMDQLISLAGRQGHAQLIDCRSLELRSVPLPERLRVLVVYSGQRRALEESGYAERRRSCEEIARRLGLAALRDASAADVADEPLGRHVVSENERVLEAAQALEDNDLDRLGRLLNLSHASLRDDFGVSTPELDGLVEALVDSGALGARLTGAGFGGSIVAICDVAVVEGVAMAATSRYRERSGLDPHAFVCRAVEGAGTLEAPLV